MVRSTFSPFMKAGLEFYAIWPDSPFNTVRRLCHVLSIYVVQFFQYIYVYHHCNVASMLDNSLADCLPATCYYCCTACKIMTLWKNRSVVRELFDNMDTDWQKCVNIKHLDLMMIKASTAKFYTHSLWIFNVFAGVLYFGTDNLAALVMTMDYNTTSRPFPIRMQYPFDAEQSPIYEVTVVVMLVHAMTLVCLVNFVSGLMLTLVFHVSGQIEIIRYEYRTISDKVLSYGSCQHIIETLIERHNKVLLFSENLDRIFSNLALVQVFCNAAVTCFLGIVLITSHNDIYVDVAKFVCPYIGISLEILVLCFAGEYLGLQNKSLGDAAYESVWYNMPPNHGKNILFIIMRSQKQQTITLGGITNLSLQAFTSIMKASASYISVLNATY